MRVLVMVASRGWNRESMTSSRWISFFADRADGIIDKNMTDYRWKCKGLKVSKDIKVGKDFKEIKEFGL